MSKFRKKPVVIEAHQYNPNGEGSRTFWDTMPAWLDNAYDEDVVGNVGEDNKSCRLKIKTLEGDMFANQGDWIIRGIKGEIYPCKPDIFAATYEAV